MYSSFISPICLNINQNPNIFYNSKTTGQKQTYIELMLSMKGTK
jgi:hypothetical protein